MVRSLFDEGLAWPGALHVECTFCSKRWQFACQHLPHNGKRKSHPKRFLNLPRAVLLISRGKLSTQRAKPVTFQATYHLHPRKKSDIILISLFLGGHYERTGAP